MIGEEAMQRQINAADKLGFDVGVHVIGDKAVALLLDWYGAAAAHNPPRDRRWRLIHYWFSTPQDITRAGQLHAIADISPGHLVLRDTAALQRSLGPERAATAFAWRAMLDAGVRIDLVSDLQDAFSRNNPLPFKPLENMYYAMTRSNAAGQPAGGWHAEQSLTIEEAIAAYTINPAYAAHEEHSKGSLTAGKLADLVVLSKDILVAPPAELLSTTVDYTILGGSIVFQHAPATSH
jgi:predicted amidohydrolase YtcJ